MANDPAVLLADESTGNLDRKNGDLVADIFHSLAAGGQTIVMVTHDQALAHRATHLRRQGGALPVVRECCADE